MRAAREEAAGWQEAGCQAAVCALGRQARPLPVVGKRQGRGTAEQVELEILPRADRRVLERKTSCPMQPLPLSASLRGRASRLTSLKVQPRVAVYIQGSLGLGSQRLPLAHTFLICTPTSGSKFGVHRKP